MLQRTIRYAKSKKYRLYNNVIIGISLSLLTNHQLSGTDRDNTSSSSSPSSSPSSSSTPQANETLYLDSVLRTLVKTQKYDSANTDSSPIIISPPSTDNNSFISVSYINKIARLIGEERSRRRRKGEEETNHTQENDSEKDSNYYNEIIRTIENETVLSSSSSSSSSATESLANGINAYHYNPVQSRRNTGTSTASPPIMSTTTTESSTPVLVVPIRSKQDAIAIDREISIIGIVRGCDASITESMVSTLDAVSKLDTNNFRYYIVTNDTPSDVVEWLEESLHMTLPETFSSTTTTIDNTNSNNIPMLAIFDRPGNTRRKFIYDPMDTTTRTTINNQGSTDDFDTTNESMDDILLSTVPYPSQLKQFMDLFVQSKLQPTYLGSERPLDDADPHHPSLTKIVASSWNDIVMDPLHDVCLEAYLTNCPMCMCLAPRIRMLSILAKNYFPHVRIGAMNVDENDRPMDWMPGPAFPTIQLFNRQTKINQLYTKAYGSECKHTIKNMKSMNEPLVESTFSSNPVVRTTFKGTPPCVPAVDFSHPSIPGKMALPSITELLQWLAEYSSTPFNPSTIFVKPEDYKDAAVRFADLFPSDQNNSKDTPLTLSKLAEDMDIEAKVLEYAIFDTFFYEHVADMYGKATGAIFNSDGHSNSLTNSPLPTYAHDYYRQKYYELKEKIANLRNIAIERGTYGTGEEALDAMDKCSSLIDGTSGIRTIARMYSFDQEEMKSIATALPLAKDLLYSDKKMKKLL